jgi:hypothetical protein
MKPESAWGELVESYSIAVDASVSHHRVSAQCQIRTPRLLRLLFLPLSAFSHRRPCTILRLWSRYTLAELLCSSLSLSACVVAL